MASKFLNPGKLLAFSNNLYTTPYAKSEFKSQVEVGINVGLLVVPTLIKILKLNENQRYIIKPFTKNAMAFVLPSTQDVFLNPKFDYTLLGWVCSYCHESIHLDQFKRGDLKRSNIGNLIWKGKEIPYESFESYVKRNAEKEYTQLPWEHDVSVRLPSLFQDVCSELGL